jgi:hypothetical protein
MSSPETSNRVMDSASMMDVIQNTTGIQSEDDSEDGSISPRSGDKELPDSVLCTKCNEMFPCNQEGSEFMFAMLCASCYGVRREDPPAGDGLPSATSNSPAHNESPPAGGHIECEEQITPRPNFLTSSGDESEKSNDENNQGHDAENSSDENNQRNEDGSNQQARNEFEVWEVDGCESEADNNLEDYGNDIGRVLSNITSNKIDRYDVVVGGNELVYEYAETMQETKKNRTFFTLIPNTTPLLYGFKHYQGYLNTETHRGWIGHCRLSTNKLGAQGHGYVLWEFWHTRCIGPRLDGIVISDTGEVELVHECRKWLTDNQLTCDLQAEFDHEFFEE